MPKAFSEHERTILRAKLIEAGKRQINRVGTRALVVDELTREAGISKGSFYAFFASKEEFILGVLEDWEESYRTELFAKLTGPTGDPRSRLERFFAGFLEMFDREPGLARLGFMEVAEIMERLPPERLKAHQDNDARRIDEASRLWIESGIIDEADLPAIGGLLNSLFILAMHREDYKPGVFLPAMKILTEALALRLAAKGEGNADR